MLESVLVLVGGIGLFLLGMSLMSDGLKAAAGETLRVLLARFTGGRFKSIASGAAATALVQSSTATTMATISFVSAGLLTFEQSVGIVLGANIGTTSTGWLVAGLGLNLKVSVAALPLVGVGALVRMFSRGRVAHLGLALAGFGLIFVGIDTLQAGMLGARDLVAPGSFPAGTLPGLLALVGIGLAMTIVMQSSSAAVATTLTALHAGAISLEQASAMVIGQNIGTTATAAIAAIGGSVAVKRTALVHILFNVITGGVAFVLLHPFVWLTDKLTDTFMGGSHELALAAFHTVFNLLGVLLFTPVLGKFAALVTRMVPGRGKELVRHLDPGIAAITPLAVDAATRTLRAVAGLLLGATAKMLTGQASYNDVEPDLRRCQEALAETRRFLARVREPDLSKKAHARHVSVLHALEHLQRLEEACGEPLHQRHFSAFDATRAIAAPVGKDLLVLSTWLEGQGKDPAPVTQAQAMSQTAAATRREHRPRVLERTAGGQTTPDGALEELEAMRWVDRVAYHAWRALAHLADGEQPGTGDVYHEREAQAPGGETPAATQPQGSASGPGSAAG